MISMSDNNPIDTLLREHEVISSAEEIIESLNNLWKTDSDKYSSSVKSLLIFFREYGDKFHHHKEEEILFRELKSNPEFHLPDLVDELENHHLEFRELLQQVEEFLNNCEWEKSYSNLQQYFQNLLDHISVENTELFSLAENFFSKDELTKIFFLFEDIDRELGYDKKNQLAKMIDGFA